MISILILPCSGIFIYIYTYNHTEIDRNVIKAEVLLHYSNLKRNNMKGKCTTWLPVLFFFKNKTYLKWISEQKFNPDYYKTLLMISIGHSLGQKYLVCETGSASKGLQTKYTGFRFGQTPKRSMKSVSITDPRLTPLCFNVSPLSRT